MGLDHRELGLFYPTMAEPKTMGKCREKASGPFMMEAQYLVATLPKNVPEALGCRGKYERNTPGSRPVCAVSGDRGASQAGLCWI